MNGPDMVVALSYLGSASVGGGLGGAAAYWLTRTQRRMAMSAVRAITAVQETREVRSDPGADEAEAMLNAHASAVRHQVSQFADALAGGDALLRARLRKIEQQRMRGV